MLVFEVALDLLVAGSVLQGVGRGFLGVELVVSGSVVWHLKCERCVKCVTFSFLFIVN